MSVIKVLKGKNRCLQRYLERTEFLLALPAAEALADMDAFQRERDAIIRAMDLYDRKAAELAQAMPVAERDAAFQSQLSEVWDERDRIIRVILELDERVMKIIEDERIRLLKTIVSSQKSSDTMKKFKSSWVPGSGEGIDQKL